MKRRYVTVDVFTETKFGGNPLAVVLDAEGLDTQAMQAVAREFNYSETTFVLPPADPAHAAHVRIFTPNEELPFAGHPNVGTACALARIGSVFGNPIGAELAFEEAAGLVAVRIERRDGEPLGAELTAPQDLSVGAMVPPVAIAECLGIPLDEVVITGHMPVVAGVGANFVIAEVHSTATLAKMRPSAAAFARHLPIDGTSKLLAYTPTGEDSLQSRMFFAVPDIREDPATGSANAALAALLATLNGPQDGMLRLAIAQGVEMGRPSLLRARVEKFAGQIVAIRIGGNCVPVMEGLLDA
jgi:trans-2,3-dihydro-3-hydroxyanthranilate isomerase